MIDGVRAVAGQASFGCFLACRGARGVASLGADLFFSGAAALLNSLGPRCPQKFWSMTLSISIIRVTNHALCTSATQRRVMREAFEKRNQ